MCTLADVRDQIKAIAASVDGSASARFLAVLEAAGITDTATLAQVLNILPRQVRRLRSTKDGGLSGPVAVLEDRGVVLEDRPSGLSGPESGLSGPPEPRACAGITTRATKDFLRKDSIQEVKQDPPVGPPKPIAEPKVLRSRGSRLSNDWQLPDDWKAWTRTNFPTSTEAAVTEEADKFRDYWTAKAGQGASKLDWQATWRNWCRTAFAPGKRRDGQPINHGRSAYDEQRAGTEHWLEEKRRRMDEVARICKIGKYRETPVESVQ